MSIEWIRVILVPGGDAMHVFDNVPWTLNRAYTAICEGEDPWVALGNFMHDFFGRSFPGQRELLLKDQIKEPAQVTQEQHQWAVFCVASVEYLSEKYHLPIPEWVEGSPSTLVEPWFVSPLARRNPRVAERMLKESPEPFAKRNVFCDERIYANKYEIKEDLEARRQSA